MDDPVVPASKARLRPWLRAIHRDVGYLGVGLTFIYAVSGIAVNHIGDYTDGDPSFQSFSETHEVGTLTGTDEEIGRSLSARLAIGSEPKEVFRSSEEELDVLFERRTLHVNTRTGHVVDEGQRPRFLLKTANWIHLNRGKKAWKYAADAYAVALLFLALSGLFMIPGRRGLFFRGLTIASIGVAIPILYVALAAH